MLTRLNLCNFQKHRSLELELAPGVTCLVGPSDAGKTAVLRALRWLAANRPSGDSFITRRQHSCTVTLGVDGHTVIRSRGDGENTYALGGGVFRSFGSDVPSAVADLLRLGPVNFQGQLDPPYLLALSPPEAARALNGVVSLDLIDRVLAAIASEARSARAEAELCQKRLEQARADRDGLAWTKEAEASLDRIEAREAGLASTASKRLAVESCLKELGRYSEGQEARSGSVLGLRKAIAACEALLEGRKQREAVGKLLAQADDCRDRAAGLGERIAAKRQEIRELTGGECPLCGGPLRV